jgi:hypothetical protein
MPADVETIVKFNVRTQSQAIFDLKEKAKVERNGLIVDHINPRHGRWRAYCGRKREATLWIAALHVVRATSVENCVHRIERAFKGLDARFLRREGERRVRRILDEVRNGHSRLEHVSQEVATHA